MKTSIKTNLVQFIKTFGIAVVIYFVTSLPQLIIVQMINNRESALSFFAVWISCVTFVWWFLYKMKYVSKPDLKILQPYLKPINVVYLAVLLFLLFVTSIFVTWLLQVSGLMKSQPLNQMVLLSVGKVIPYPVFITLVGGAGFFEELLFRKVLFDYFDKWSGILAIFVTACLFSFVHTSTDIGSFLNYLSYGLFFGMLRYKTQSIIPNIILHSCWNVLLALIVF